MFASQNDPLMSFKRAQFWAECWGSRVIDIGEAGHINTESGFGEWSMALSSWRNLVKPLSMILKSRFYKKFIAYHYSDK
jgi:predicted alpha/beta hydrolase family esterase